MCTQLFILQACQGSQLDEGTKLVRVSRTEVDSQPPSYRIPNHADFLIAYSTFPGHYAWRNTTNGSWFIQAVCSVLTKYSNKKDLLAMMTIICREVSELLMYSFSIYFQFLMIKHQGSVCCIKNNRNAVQIYLNSF